MAVSTIIHYPAGVNLSAADTVRQFALGTRAFGDNGGEFVYCSFAGTVAVNSMVSIDLNFAATAFADASPLGNIAGVLRESGVVAGTWAWVQIKGQCNVVAAASVSANVAIAGTTTAGTVGAAAGATGRRAITGMVLSAASGAGGATEATLNYPASGATI